jgi:hypothetical protein
MSWVITPQQRIPAVIGEAFGGGFFAGYISHTADGNPTHALIVAPKATGATIAQFKTTNTVTAGTSSDFNGFANTAAMVTAGIAVHPAGNFCTGLSIGGFTDWYLPARLELDIAYFNLKPDSTANNAAFGANIYAVPQRNSNWTSSYPTQTVLTAFSVGTEAFALENTWSSTQDDISAFARLVDFRNGARNLNNKDGPRQMRAFRRIAL